jgi:hypothetical protein
MRRARLDLLLSALLVLLMVWVIWEARDWPFRTRLFPWMLGLPVLALALFQLGVAVRNVASPRPVEPAADGLLLVPAPRPATDDTAAAAPITTTEPRVARARAVALIAWMVAFFVAIWLLGFRLGAPLASLAFLRLYARESWSASLGLSLGMYLFFVVLEAGLSVPLPAGVIPQALGFAAWDVSLVSALRRALLGR